MNAETITRFIWPAVALILALTVLRMIRDEIRPLARAIIGGVAQNAQRNATAYAIAFGFGLSASLAAFVDVFQKLAAADLAAISWHQYAAMWAKVLNPFVVAVLAYATQNKFEKPPGTRPAGDTNPPIAAG